MPSMLPLLLLLLAAAVALLADTAAANPSIGDVIGQIRERAAANAAAAAEDGGRTTSAPPNKTRNERILEQWSKFEINLQDLVDSVIRKVLPTVIRRSSELEVSPDCRDALLKVVFGIRQLKRWAFQYDRTEIGGIQRAGRLGSAASFERPARILVALPPPTVVGRVGLVSQHCLSETLSRASSVRSTRTIVGVGAFASAAIIRRSSQRLRGL
ncbi:hypothetical protein HPB49_006656 [Dermacentor silvarum]|uniref:Uncharacterized protein n=1 Tax=Dermacentor silvarum TaxID=543639 RepID=A0ACB8DWN0_DERSI|nr:hypothetical protein HPB49_006656 [Dermacentor silvarum]